MGDTDKSFAMVTESRQKTVTFNTVHDRIMRLISTDIMKERSDLEVSQVYDSL